MGHIEWVWKYVAVGDKRFRIGVGHIYKVCNILQKLGSNVFKSYARLKNTVRLDNECGSTLTLELSLIIQCPQAVLLLPVGTKLGSMTDCAFFTKAW